MRKLIVLLDNGDKVKKSYEIGVKKVNNSYINKTAEIIVSDENRILINDVIDYEKTIEIGKVTYKISLSNESDFYKLSQMN